MSLPALRTAHSSGLLAPVRPAATGRLPRLLYAIGLEAGHKFGSMEEQVNILQRAFQDAGSALVPVYQRGAVVAEDAFAQDAPAPAGVIDLTRFDLRRASELERLVREHRCDGVHWHFYPALNPYLLWLGLRFRGLRQYVTDHSSRHHDNELPPPGLKGAVQKRFLRNYRAALGVSDYVVEHLRRSERFPEVRRYRHFVNVQRFAPDREARRKMRQDLAPPTPFVAVVIAHLIPEKGVQVLLRAVAALSSPITLWIVGEGRYSAELRALSSQLGLDGRVRFLGHRHRVEPYLQAADVAVCPSTWAEAAGLVNLEAAACGTPMIASRVGGIPEFVGDGSTGLLVRPNDAPALASAIARLRDDAALRGRMARAARDRAEREFSPEACLHANLHVYRADT